MSVNQVLVKTGSSLIDKLTKNRELSAIISSPFLAHGFLIECGNQVYKKPENCEKAENK